MFFKIALFLATFAESWRFNRGLSLVLVRPEVQEVAFNKTAILHCPSHDEDHNFMFWQLADSLCGVRGVIGPGNEYNRSKYNYEILTGKLFINRVSLKEEGILNCVSKGVRNDDVYIRAVRMVVKKDWEKLYEDDPHINVLRAFILLGSLIVVFGGGFLLYRSWKDKRDMELFMDEDDDDESNEELFSRPGPSYRGSRSRTPSPSPFRHSMDSSSFRSFNSEVSLAKQSTKSSTQSKDVDPFDPFGDEEPNFNI